MTIVEAIVVFVGLLFGFGGAFWVTRTYALTKPNFRGDVLPKAYGMAFVLGGIFIYAYEWRTMGWHVGSAAAYVVVLFGFGTLGLLDDISGDRTVGGFRGHFRALVHGKLTTGAAKAIGGGVIALVAGFLLAYPIKWEVIVSALLIALSANTLNLLDLRPGRCVFGFFCGALCILLTLIGSHAVGVGFLFWVACAFAVILYPLDAGGIVMLGDTGSNAFGAVLGVAGSLYFAPAWQVVIVAGLIAFQAWCEKHSFSGLIRDVPLLSRLDRQIGVR